MYGITETTVHVTYRPITGRLAKGREQPDRRGDPGLVVPAGCRAGVVPGSHGELVIGQAGLARGYHGRPG
nr:hypothetical protein [Pseudomonas asiatica]